MAKLVLDIAYYLYSRYRIQRGAAPSSYILDQISRTTIPPPQIQEIPVAGNFTNAPCSSTSFKSFDETHASLRHAPCAQKKGKGAAGRGLRLLVTCPISFALMPVSYMALHGSIPP